MAIERTELLDEEQQEQGKQRAAEIAELRDKAHKEELARVRAEAESDTLRKAAEIFKPNGTVSTGPAAPTEDQWVALEAQTGMNRQAILANQQMTFNQVQAARAELDAKLKAVEERAVKAEERASRFESKRGSEAVVDSFYDDKPAFKAYKKEVSEFLDMFPESEKNDPEKLKKILGKAETYVKGMVGGKVRSAGNTGSARLGGGFDDEQQDEAQRIDFTGLENNHERRLISDIAGEFNSREDKELVDKAMSSDKLGVRFDSESEFKTGDAMLRRKGSFGGKNG